METITDPQRKIQALGEKGIDLQVFDPESGVSRLIKVNPFEPSAPAFKGTGGIVDVCNSIKQEVNNQRDKSNVKTVFRPVRTPEIGLDQGKSQDNDSAPSLGGRP